MDELLEYHKERIQKLINLYNLKNTEIAKLTKTDKNTIKSYLQSDRFPTTKTVLAFATTFGISLDWLYGITDTPYTKETIKIAENECYMKFQITVPYRPNTEYSLEARANLIILQQYRHIIKNSERKSNKVKTISETIEKIAQSGNPVYTLE